MVHLPSFSVQKSNEFLSVDLHLSLSLSLSLSSSSLFLLPGSLHLLLQGVVSHGCQEKPRTSKPFPGLPWGLGFRLATSLLADGLAVAGQAILASAFAKKDYDKAAATASRVLQLGLVLGLMLAVILGVGLQYGARLFTKDVDVLHLISIGIPFVAATQPINALGFVFDGVNFGASDFAYSTLVSSDSPMLKRTAVLDAEDSPMQLC